MTENKKTVDKSCPICGEDIRSDAKVHEFCKLCGIGIKEPEFAPQYETTTGEIFIFAAIIA
jgi:hypothetical protein